ncbi:putative rlpA-like protein, double-psi beta-barrel [Helianthus anomalus]
MASISLIVFTILVVNISCSMCFLRMANTGLATWYGPEEGAGKGAACGWEDDVHDPPFNAMIAAGNSNIFLNGKGCGHCFQACWFLILFLFVVYCKCVKNILTDDEFQIINIQIHCSRKPYCSGKPISVTISDQCPGACNNIAYHFDLSGHAFGMMANHGQEHSLRQLGQVDIEFKSKLQKSSFIYVSYCKLCHLSSIITENVIDVCKPLQVMSFSPNLVNFCG